MAHMLLRSVTSIGLSSLAVAAVPALAASAPQARLVHCGQETCLRIRGQRAQASDDIRIAGQELAVAGGRQWRVTVPMPIARHWPTAPGGTLTLALTDSRTGAERLETVVLPPGAFGRRVELATLVVRAH